MKRILLFLFCFVGSFVANAQYPATGLKQQFKNGIALGSRDSTAFGANDSLVVSIDRNGKMIFRGNGVNAPFKVVSVTSDTAAMLLPYLRKSDTASMLAPYVRSSSLGIYLLKSDSLSGGYTTWLLTKKKVDSLGAVKLNISDTAAMLLPYARTSSLGSYLLKSDSLSGGYTTWLLTKKKVDSLGAVKLNISDTAAMLSPYVRTSGLGSYLLKSDSLSGGYTTWLLTKKKIDSLGAVKLNVLDTAAMLANRLKISDTAYMLSGYLRKGDTSAMLSNYVPTFRTINTNAPLFGGGNLSANRTFGIDTGRAVAQVVTGGSLTAVKDSLLSVIASSGGGTVLSVSTTNGFGINSSVATATSTPNITIAVDTFAVSTRDWRNKGIDSVQNNLVNGLALKLNISDTAAMLAGYKTYYPRTAISLTTTGSSGAATYNNATGVLNIPQYAPDLSGYVPYTGATANVNLGAFDLTADVITGATGSFASSGSGNTLDITHSSGSGIALNITKSGNGEGLYINKTSGSGNAATIVGTLQATTLVKTGGTSSQFLKADGSVDGTAYGTGSVTSVATNTGSGITGGTITTSGTIAADTTILSTKANVTGLLVGYATTGSLAGKLNISDTATMLSNYRRKTTLIENADLRNSIITINGSSTSLGGSISVGTVTSVAASAGTGISVTGSPITSSGTLTITNTAPDQTVTLTAGSGISVTGTYPNFTVANTSPSSGGTVTSVSAGTGMSFTTITSSGAVNADTTVLATRAYAAGLDVAKANTSLNNVNGVLSSTYGGAGSVSGILKANGSGVVSAAVNNTDYTLLNGTGFVRMSGTTPSYVTGTSSQFVKADGSLDGTSYATAASLSGYLPLSGGTLSGALSGTSASFSGAVTSTQTSGIFLSNSSGGTNAVQARINNTGGDLRIGTESSAGETIQIGALPYAAVFGNQANAATQFTTNGTVRATITSTGNVGIGTTTPSTKLDVVGAATFSSSVTASEGLFGGAVTNGTDKLRVSGNTSTSQLITGSFNPNMTLRNTATTLSSLYTTVIAQGGSNYTYTLDAASGHNRIYIIRAYGSGSSITLNRSGSDVIVDNAGNNQTSLTITPSGGAVWVQSNGSDAYIQLK